MSDPTNQDTPVARQWRCVEDGEERTGWKDIDLGDLDGWARYADKHPGKVVIEYRALYSSDQFDWMRERAERAEAECERLRKDRYDLACAITGGEDAPGLLDAMSTSELVKISRENNALHLDILEKLEAENRRLRERYENWQPIDTPPHPATSPYALLEFYCVSEADEDEENAGYWITRTWGERPDDAVYWCAINSPELRREHIAALTKLQDTSHD